jgi:hypothetical protein
VGQIQRAYHMDVSNSIDVTDTAVVAAVSEDILCRGYPQLDRAALARLFADFHRLYRGNYPGFHPCDVAYHNQQHVLDVTLAMARLLDGYHLRHGSSGMLSAEMALTGMAAALFHDAGYIRRLRDSRHSNGAAYTRVHVSRSARFLRDYLPDAGLARLSPACARIVHFTGYELSVDNIRVATEAERLVGMLLGTADLIAQMADIDYVRKCRDDLYEEFVVGGMAGLNGHYTHTGTIYRSPEQLLKMTPTFIRTAIHDRLDGHFEGVHRYAAAHFDGRHLYMEAIVDNCERLESLLAASR